MKKPILLLLLMATTAIWGFNRPTTKDCLVEYDSYKQFASVCNHYIKVNDKKYTIIDNGCKETRDGIINSLKKNGCDVSLTFNSYREDWASKN